MNGPRVAHIEFAVSRPQAIKLATVLLAMADIEKRTMKSLLALSGFPHDSQGILAAV
jgi:hypothetical protein